MKIFLNQNQKVSDFNTSQWNIPLLNQVLNNHRVVQKIKENSNMMNGIEDSFCWGLNNSSEFYTKSVTWAAHEIQY